MHQIKLLKQFRSAHDDEIVFELTLKKSNTNTLKKRSPFKLHFIHLFSIFKGFLKYKNHDIPAAKTRHKGINQSENSALKLYKVLLS